ncbi:MAG TPA: DUF4476 domain-containing protein [Chitinophagaceae bacterium]|nr:DUF4476 domain-containing protein [Chitinophagaceae bacterium]
MFKKLLALISLLVLVAVIVHAQQQIRFAYIQLEDQRGFYVKWNGKILSSSNGYLIIPQIKEPQINIIIGFSKGFYPEQLFTISFEGSTDAGFMLKNFGEKGWGLYNLQSLNVIYATNNSSKPGIKENVNAAPSKTITREQETKNTFGDLLVQVTRDSTIKNTVVGKPANDQQTRANNSIEVVDNLNKKPFKEDEKQINFKTETNDTSKESQTKQVPFTKISSISKESDIKASPNNPVKENIKQQNLPVNNLEEKKSTINLYAAIEKVDGWDYIYIDEGKAGKKDTIRIFIEKGKEEIIPAVGIKPAGRDVVKQETNLAKPIILVSDTEKNKVAKQGEGISKSIVNDSLNMPLFQKKSSDTVNQKESAKTYSTVLMVNTDCKTVATDKDFISLRKRMVAEGNDDNMITLARKVFKTKCFTSEQVKNLCVLFLNDEGKYRFLDAAYPFVYDTDSFKQLVSLLTDNYYIDRFKVMVKK